MRQVVLVCLGCAGLVLGLFVYGLLRDDLHYGFPLEQILSGLAPLFTNNFSEIVPVAINESLPSFFWQISLSSLYYAVFCKRTAGSSLIDKLLPFFFGIAEEVSQYFRTALSFDGGDIVAICLAASTVYLIAFTAFRPTELS